MNEKKHSEINNLGSIWENIIIACIIIVLVITFLDDLAVIYHWSVKSRGILIILGFVFDVIFTAEFIARTIINSRHKAGWHYILHQRGWIDFLSSVPLLLLNSMWEFMFYVGLLQGEAGSKGILSAIKVVKAVRVTRILRLLRMVKILGKIHNTDSHMANRHIAVISTTAIMSIIIAYSAFSFSGYLNVNAVEQGQIAFYEKLLENVPRMKENLNFKNKNDSRVTKKIMSNLLFDMKHEESQVIQIYYKGQLLIQNYTRTEIVNDFHYDHTRPIKERFNDPNVLSLEKNDFTMFINMSSVYREATKVQLVIFVCILLMVLAFMTLYTRHFVQNVTDVVHVMQKGLEDKDFNLEVKVRDEFIEDEIFKLAQTYNETWLPVKSKEQEKEEENDTGGLTLDDFMNQ